VNTCDVAPVARRRLSFGCQLKASVGGAVHTGYLTITNKAIRLQRVAFFVSGSHADLARGRNSSPTAAATRSKARLERPRSRRTNLLIELAGNLACPAIRRSGRPSVRTAARSESEAEIIRDVLIVNPFFR
jgi:hypothetical protein